MYIHMTKLLYLQGQIFTNINQIPDGDALLNLFADDVVILVVVAVVVVVDILFLYIFSDLIPPILLN